MNANTAHASLEHPPLPASAWQEYRFSHESSLPGLTNHLGSLQIEADPIAVKHVIFPPVSSAEETTGMTTLDGELIALSGEPVSGRWLPTPSSVDGRKSLGRSKHRRSWFQGMPHL